MTATLDRLDIKILSILQSDGRITNRRLAEAVGLSQSACLDRVRRLQSAEVISGFKAVLNRDILGGWIAVFAQLTLEKQGGQRQQRFEQWALECPQIVECFEVSGAQDYVVRFVCETIPAYQDLTARMLEDESLGISEIKSHIVMREVKADGGVPIAALDDSVDVPGSAGR